MDFSSLREANFGQERRQIPGNRLLVLTLKKFGSSLAVSHSFEFDLILMLYRKNNLKLLKSRFNK